MDEAKKWKEAVFVFLDNLRASSDVNMCGTVPDIADEFNINKYEARELLKEWMATFKKARD